MSACLFASASTMSLPLCSVLVLISMFCFAKYPLLIPSVSGRAFAIGRVSSVIVSSIARWRFEALAPDQAVDVPAQPGELGQLFGHDLVAGHRQVDADDLLHLGRRLRQ